MRLAMLALMVWFVLDGLPHIVAWRQRMYGPPPRQGPNPHDWVDPAKGLGIINFYASPPAIFPGRSASVCYGVMNAVSVAIDPPIAEVSPALTRCFEVSPKTTTRYTLTAADKRGNRVSRSFLLNVLGTPPAR